MCRGVCDKGASRTEGCTMGSKVCVTHPAKPSRGNNSSLPSLHCTEFIALAQQLSVCDICGTDRQHLCQETSRVASCSANA